VNLFDPILVAVVAVPLHVAQVLAAAAVVAVVQVELVALVVVPGVLRKGTFAAVVHSQSATVSVEEPTPRLFLET